MFSPPRMMMSFLRSMIVRQPSSSSTPTSPVANQPSASNAAVGERGVGVADEAVGAPAPDLARLARPDVVAVVVDAAGSRHPRSGRAVGVQPLLARDRRASQPVIDGCSVEPKLRTVEMPSRSARSPTAAGTGEPPRPMRGMSAACAGGEVGMVEQAGEEVRGAAAARQLVLEHRREHARRVPHVDEVDRVAPAHRDEQRGEHADAVADRRADEHRAAAVRACIAPSWRISELIVRCECTTPFGSDVVPDVYAMSAGAAGRRQRARRSARRRRARRTTQARRRARRRRRPTTCSSVGQRRRAASSRLARKSRWPKRSAVTSDLHPTARRMKPTSFGP